MQQIYWKDLCQSVISIKLLSSFIEITIRYGCSPLYTQHIFRTPFHKITYGEVLESVLKQHFFINFLLSQGYIVQFTRHLHQILCVGNTLMNVLWIKIYCTYL